MKIGDYVGWADHDVDDKEPIRPAGIILEVEKSQVYNADPAFARYLILMQHNGDLGWEYGSDLVVIHESR